MTNSIFWDDGETRENIMSQEPKYYIIFNNFQTSARDKKKQKKKRFHVIKKNNAVKSKLESNQSKQTATSNINAVYIQIHKQLGIYSKARQLSSIFVHINKRTTTSLFTFNSN